MKDCRSLKRPKTKRSTKKCVGDKSLRKTRVYSTSETVAWAAQMRKNGEEAPYITHAAGVSQSNLYLRLNRFEGGVAEKVLGRRHALSPEQEDTIRQWSIDEPSLSTIQLAARVAENSAMKTVSLSTIKRTVKREEPKPKHEKHQVLFFRGNDHGSSHRKLLNLIQLTKRNLDVCIYVLTRDEVWEGANIRVIVDGRGSELPASKVEKLRAEGGKVRMEPGSRMLHNKFMLIDRSTRANGSVNYSVAGMKSNIENVEIHYRDVLRSKYHAEFGAM